MTPPNVTPQSQRTLLFQHLIANGDGAQFRYEKFEETTADGEGPVNNEFGVNRAAFDEYGY